MATNANPKAKKRYFFKIFGIWSNVKWSNETPSGRNELLHFGRADQNFWTIVFFLFVISSFKREE